MAENKTKPTKLSVAAFIDALPEPTRRADAKALVKLMQSAAGEKPKMWGGHPLLASAATTTDTRAGGRAICRLSLSRHVRPQLFCMA
jgi:hypothetical protein